jgi:hypothetical protein
MADRVDTAEQDVEATGAHATMTSRGSDAECCELRV